MPYLCQNEWHSPAPPHAHRRLASSSESVVPASTLRFDGGSGGSVAAEEVGYLNAIGTTNVMNSGEYAGVLVAIDREIEAHEQELRVVMGSRRFSEALGLTRTFKLNDTRGNPTQFTITVDTKSIQVRVDKKEIPSTIETATETKYDHTNYHIKEAFLTTERSKVENKDDAITLLCTTRHQITDIAWRIEGSLLFVEFGRELVEDIRLYELFELKFTLQLP